MFGTTTTAGLIDEFESRFTTDGGARFLIARAGDEAWPISERESIQFRERYRRRMMRARLIRRVSMLLFPALLVLGWQLPREPRWLTEAVQVLIVLALFTGPFFGSLQHQLTSDITQKEIEREIERRISTSFEPAITPAEPAFARVVRKVLILAGMILLAMEISHLLGPREEFAGHIRVLTGLTAGNESALARLTGTLAYWLTWMILIGSLLLWLGRRERPHTEAKGKPLAEKADAP
jgi:hypothetical protein